MNKKNAIFAPFLIILTSLIFWQFAKNLKKYFAVASASVITYKNEYLSGDNLKVKIANNLGKNICFSTCYPYRLEKKDKTWQSYKYVECDRDNIHNGCVDNGKTKAFELTLPESISGTHRLAIPICSTACGEGQSFREESILYSNEFIVR